MLVNRQDVERNIQRLPRRILKDQITRMESQLIPDLNA